MSRVEPQHFRAVVEKFMAGPAPEEDILGFVKDYLSARKVDGNFPDLASALAALERLA